MLLEKVYAKSYVTEFWFKLHNVQDNFLIDGKLQLSALNCTRFWMLLFQNVVMIVCSFPPFFGRLVYRAGRCALLSQTNYFPGYPPAVMAWWPPHPSDEDVLYSAFGKPPQHRGLQYPIWFNSMFEFCQKMIHPIFD